MVNAMFKHIILSSNYHGQLHAGFAKTIKFCRNLILPHLDVHSVRSDDILRTNLQYLYKKNMELQGPRLNIGGDHSMTIATGACSLNNASINGGVNCVAERMCMLYYSGWIDLYYFIRSSYFFLFLRVLRADRLFLFVLPPRELKFGMCTSVSFGKRKIPDSDLTAKL